MYPTGTAPAHLQRAQIPILTLILTKAPPTQPSKIIDLNYITISTCFLLLARPSQVEKHLINTFPKPACSSMHSIRCCFKKARTGLHLKDKELCTVNQNV